jgi:hypothetical protein
MSDTGVNKMGARFDEQDTSDINLKSTDKGNLKSTHTGVNQSGNCPRCHAPFCYWFQEYDEVSDQHRRWCYLCGKRDGTLVFAPLDRPTRMKDEG